MGANFQGNLHLTDEVVCDQDYNINQECQVIEYQEPDRMVIASPNVMLSDMAYSSRILCCHNYKRFLRFFKKRLKEIQPFLHN